MKTIMFAVGLAGALTFAGLSLGLVEAGHVSVKAAYWGVALGGALLGIGFAIAGLCPGTGLAAAATGRIDAVFFVVWRFGRRFCLYVGSRERCQYGSARSTLGRQNDTCCNGQ